MDELDGRILIAKKMGISIPRSDDYCCDYHWKENFDDTVKDYFNSLDEMFKVEEWILDRGVEEWFAYIDQLRMIVYDEVIANRKDVIEGCTHASANQKARVVVKLIEEGIL